MIALATHIITTAPCIGTKIIRTPGGTCPGSRIAGPCVIARAKIVTIRNNRNLSMQKIDIHPISMHLPDMGMYATVATCLMMTIMSLHHRRETKWMNSQPDALKAGGKVYDDGMAA